MALIVRYENSYDASVPNVSHLYVLNEVFRPTGHASSESDDVSFVPFPFLKQDFPEIGAAIRMLQEPLVVRAGLTLSQEKVTLTDPAFFSVFKFPLLAGDSSTALDGPGKVVISTNMARKYFGTEQALGKRLRIDNGQTEAIVSGILAQHDVHRLVCITGMGAGDSRGHGGFLYDCLFLPLMLRKVYEDKDRQEEAIRASALDWTIARADVADFVVQQLIADTWLRKAPLITW